MGLVDSICTSFTMDIKPNREYLVLCVDLRTLMPVYSFLVHKSMLQRPMFGFTSDTHTMLQHGLLSMNVLMVTSDDEIPVFLD